MLVGDLLSKNLTDYLINSNLIKSKVLQKKKKLKDGSNNSNRLFYQKVNLTTTKEIFLFCVFITCLKGFSILFRL